MSNDLNMEEKKLIIIIVSRIGSNRDSCKRVANFFKKVVANFRLGDKWEKNQLTWFLTKVAFYTISDPSYICILQFYPE